MLIPRTVLFRHRFYIDADNVEASLEYVKGYVAEHVRHAEEFLRFYEGQLVHTEKRDIESLVMELNELVAHSAVFDQERIEQVSRTLRKKDIILSRIEKEVNGPERQRLAVRKRDLEHRMGELKHQVSEIYTRFPRSWISEALNKHLCRFILDRKPKAMNEIDFTQDYNVWLDAFERNFVYPIWKAHDANDVIGYMRHILGHMMSHVIPRDLERRKREKPIEWHTLINVDVQEEEENAEQVLDKLRTLMKEYHEVRYKVRSELDKLSGDFPDEWTEQLPPGRR